MLDKVAKRCVVFAKPYTMQVKSELNFKSIQIDGTRVQLVSITRKYSEIIFSEFTDEITRYMIPATPENIQEIDTFINTSLLKMDQGTDIILVILDRQTGEFLGVCGVHGQPNPDEPILGIWLKKSAHGNHYGQEAMSHLVGWLRDNISFIHLVYPCDKDNIASRKVAEQLGGVIFHEGQTKSMSGTVLNEVAYKIL